MEVVHPSSCHHACLHVQTQTHSYRQTYTYMEWSEHIHTYIHTYIDISRPFTCTFYEGPSIHTRIPFHILHQCIFNDLHFHHLYTVYIVRSSCYTKILNTQLKSTYISTTHLSFPLDLCTYLRMYGVYTQYTCDYRFSLAC